MPRRKRRKTVLHPIIAGVKKRQREIATLTRAAQIVGLTLDEIVPTKAMRKAKRMTPHRAKRYYKRLAAEAAQAPERVLAPMPVAVAPTKLDDDFPLAIDRRKKKAKAA